MIVHPSTDEVEQYGRRPERGTSAVPLIADDEAVCLVRSLESGSGAYWSRGDVDVHVLHAKQHGLTDALVGGLTPGASLAQAMRERREQRLRLLRGGVQTTAGGLVLLNPQPQLLLPTRM